MSVKVMSEVLDRSQATLGARLVLLVLADFAGDEHRTAWPSVGRIAEMAKLSERQVQYALRRLEENGEVERIGQSQHGTFIYRIGLLGGADIAPLEDEGVQPTAPGGVQPIAPEPPLQPSEVREANASLTSDNTKNGHRPRPPDVVWDALEAIFGVAPPKTNAHARRNKACADLRAFAATPDEIVRAHRAWPDLYENATCTDIALATHYAQLVQAKPTPGEQVRRLMAEKGIE